MRTRLSPYNEKAQPECIAGINSKQYIPGLGDPKAAGALAILKATIPLWQDGKNRQGYLDPATWQAMARFLLAYHILSGQKIQLRPTVIATYRRERRSESTQRCHAQECYLVSCADRWYAP